MSNPRLAHSRSEETAKKKKERNDKEFAQFGGLGQTESALDQG